MIRESCGTLDGWRRHQRGHEKICERCRPVGDAYQDRLIRMRKPRKTPTDAEYAQHVLPRPEGCGLTEREWQVVALIARGWSNAQIGRKLILAEDTVKSHVRRILERHEVGTRAELTALAYRRGWLTADLLDGGARIQVGHALFDALVRVARLAEDGRVREAQALSERIALHLPPRPEQQVAQKGG